MPALTATYLLPAIFLNPAFILHIFNTFVSHLTPPPTTISQSPHPFMESLGPLPGSTPSLDMHADDQLCWRYTVFMVIVQLLAFGRVQDNRIRRRSAKAARLERERLRKEKLEKFAAGRIHTITKMNGHTAGGVDGACDVPEECTTGLENGNGMISTKTVPCDDGKTVETGTEESMTETSEEEMMV